ncbi:MAG: hypothetical protein DI586_07190 [Micavibrio aeruginosavorus]|uniref:Protein SirB1 N-terminal domain-containing protein n=1 Tax=Micavibrio aeruginosavorus TaxID=349221 RepID=A0A2W5FJE3_9BACT|nr:MAG: hypothetical protein DI586_07190 [Micavibrio aeruginosavorus]
METNDVLQSLGSVPDHEIPLAETALLLSASYAAGIDLDRYRNHLSRIAEDVGLRYAALLEAGADDSAETRLASLKHIISDQYQYEGNTDNYDDLENADLVRVIDRRKGLPISLAIITLHAAKAQGWLMEGINFPGHFLLRLEKGSHRLITDPFSRFQIMQASDLRSLLKKIAGNDAELSASYYESATSRDILIRLQNNIKHRQIENEDYEGALKIVEQMRLIAPRENRLLFDSGVLHARNGRIRAAIGILEEYLKEAPTQTDRRDAELFLSSLRDGLQ